MTTIPDLTEALAWVEQRPEDEHTRVVREGLLDLHKTGYLHPHDGVWPEEA